MQYGYITPEQELEAAAYQKAHPSMRFGAVLVELGFVTENQVLEALGQRLNLPLINLKTVHINTEAVAQIPRQLAMKYSMVAIDSQPGRLTVVMSDPLNFYAIEDIRQITQMTLDIMLDVEANILATIENQYAEIEAKAAARMINTAAQMQVETIDVVDDDTSEEAPIVQVLNRLLLRGYTTAASDVHIEPFEERVSVRMRMDGVITEYVTLPKNLHLSLVARIKILANLDIAERRLPQDGHFKITIEGTQINARVSMIPTIHGEKVVVRFLFPNAVVDAASTFGMTPSNYEKFSRMLSSPHGIVYITGPTGSGKTTTLYMVLERMAQKNVNISTIEDPVERNIDRINQVQVNNVSGITFERGLRSLMRQDPDVIMVGETRDAETAEISVRAAITGHLVLSTLHTNDAISSIIRLKDMGIPPYMIANSLVGLVAQRLMRKVCPNCREEYPAEKADQLALSSDVQTLARGKGCHVCNNTGYKGRIAVHEVVLLDKAMRRLVAEDATVEAITEYATEHQGFESLRTASARLVIQGISTMEEFSKIAYYSD